MLHFFLKRFDIESLSYYLFANCSNAVFYVGATKYAISVGDANFASLAVMLKVYDFLAREIATLVNAKQQLGNYEIKFNADGLTSGVYFYTLRSGNFVKTKKMLIIR